MSEKNKQIQRNILREAKRDGERIHQKQKNLNENEENDVKNDKAERIG